MIVPPGSIPDQRAPNIVLLGPSGAGKGTQAEKLAPRFDLVHLSTGDLFRANVETGTALGLIARRYLARSELVPDDVVDAMIEEQLRRIPPERGVLFDGFPRTETQAQFLDALFGQVGRSLDAAIFLKLPEQRAFARLAERLVCSRCHRPYPLTAQPPSNRCDACGGELQRRLDDQGQAASLRLAAFYRSARPLAEYYARRGRLVVIDAAQSIDRVSEEMADWLERLARNEAAFVPIEQVDEIEIAPAPAAPARPKPGRVPGRNIVLLGAPGCGKGTQAEMLSRQWNLPHIATGDLFRENLKHETSLGQIARSYMNSGQLVPDDVTTAMVQERLGRPDAVSGFILDGFPRNLAQARELMSMLDPLGQSVSAVVYFHVSDNALITRLSGRMICRDCQTPYHLQFKPPRAADRCDLCGGPLMHRDDDNPETVRARLKTFHAQTEPLIEFFRRAGIVLQIDGEADPQQVFQRAIATLFP